MDEVEAIVARKHGFARTETARRYIQDCYSTPDGGWLPDPEKYKEQERKENARNNEIINELRIRKATDSVYAAYKSRKIGDAEGYYWILQIPKEQPNEIERRMSNDDWSLPE